MRLPPRSADPQDDKLPRGALIIVAIGLVACLVAALATVGKGEGESAHLEWVQLGTAPDSKTTAIAGGKGEMQLVDTHIRATGTNVSGYSLFTAGSTLRISAGAPIGGGRILCRVKAGKGTEVAQSAGGLRGTYPRSSEEGIYNQEVPETVLMDFSSHSSELATLEVLDRPKRFTTEQGVKLEWPEYEAGTENLKYFITGKPKKDLELPFFTVWRTTKVPAARIACALETGAGESTVSTKVALPHRSPPIDEEAEAEKAEEKEELEAEEEAEEES
ncbi:MAG TPA: hypothetical protein VFX35_11780 [Solirubrobacterales bacterium]|nr:hypothetical protein [Solirubrobacterales bacterium]